MKSQALFAFLKSGARIFLVFFLVMHAGSVDPRAGVAPWLEDSFEGPAPSGWKSEWSGNTDWTKYVTFDTTDAGGAPPGGGQYSYRQRFMAPDGMRLVTADNTTNTFTAADHGYQDGNLIRFWHLHQGGTLPTGIEHATDLGASFSVFYRVMNATQNTFQVRWNLEETGPTNITNNGVPPFYTTLARQVTADHATNTFTAADHGLEDDAPIILHLLGQGGALPTGIQMHTESYSYQYHVMNATEDTFQLRRYLTSSRPTDITDSGADPFFLSLVRRMGRLAVAFGAGHPVPHTIGDGDDISFSYWMKYHPDFRWGAAITGNKQWMLDAGFTGSGTGRIYQITQWGSEQVISPSGTGGMWGLRANVGGPFYMPNGEWVKFDWYIKVSPESGDGGLEGDGVIMGWVNDELRWNYSDIPTIKSGAFSSFHYWNQHSNNVPRGENQERYLDLFRVGPGRMVLSQYGLAPPGPAAGLHQLTGGVSVMHPHDGSEIDFRFRLGAAAMVDIDMFARGGELVKKLCHREFAAGDHQVVWDGRNAKGEVVASGTYVARIQLGSQEVTRKVVVIR